ncbi:protein kinase [Streptomyces sp. KL116D]|uniref:protein kinase domain-containing protein n=1 Tax=Streptomyces sp. KL116D TaxID=3045152 RepID=UPI0035567E13
MRGRRLNGRYELVEVIGSGGMGEVWRARDHELGRDVAVKVLRAGPSDSGAGEDGEALARFRREARVAAAIDSPHVVAVHDHGTDGARPYLVMALVEGRTLQEILRDDVRVPVADALRWTADVCRGLAVAHAAGVVHRDIKPANIMVSGEGDASRARIVDFGIARYVAYRAADPRLTHTGQLPFGSVQYMAPERFRDGAGDARTDLYAVGCVLYELLVGRPPFVGDAAGVMFNHLHDVPLRPSRARSGVGPAVDRLVLDLMAKEPDERPADARAALERVLAVSAPADAPSTSPSAPPSARPSTEVPTNVSKTPGPQEPSGPAAQAASGPARAVPDPAPEDDRPHRTVPHVVARTPPAAPPPPVRRSRRGLVLGIAAALLAVGVTAGVELRQSSGGESADGGAVAGPPPAPRPTGPPDAYTIALAHRSGERDGELMRIREQVVRAALAEAERRSKHKVPLDVVVVSEDDESPGATVVDRHPETLALLGDVSDLDDYDTGMAVVDVCNARWAAGDGTYGMPATDFEAGRQAGRYLRGAFAMDRVMDAADYHWDTSYSDKDTFGHGLRASGLTAFPALDRPGSDVPVDEFLRDFTKKEPDAVVVSDLPGHDDEDRIAALKERGERLAVRNAYANACDTLEDRQMYDRHDAELPDGTLRFRTFSDERQKPDCADFPRLCSVSAEMRDWLTDRGTAELYDATLAVAAGVDRTLAGDRPGVGELDTVRTRLRAGLEDVEVDGLLGHYSFKDHRAQNRPVWVDRRVDGRWKQLGTVAGLTGASGRKGT